MPRWAVSATPRVSSPVHATGSCSCRSISEAGAVPAWPGGTVRPLEPVACGPPDRGGATQGDKVLWVGCLNHVPPSLVGPGTGHVDLAGRALLPGFVDAHSHMFGDAPSGW